MAPNPEQATHHLTQARAAIIFGLIYLVFLFITPGRDGWIYTSAAGTILVMGAAARGHYRFSQENQPQTTELRWLYAAVLLGFLVAFAAAIGRNIT